MQRLIHALRDSAVQSSVAYVSVFFDTYLLSLKGVLFTSGKIISCELNFEFSMGGKFGEATTED